jgi:hypothetical protein
MVVVVCKHALGGDEEVVQVAGDEGGGGRMLADDVNHVLAVEVAHFAQESLFCIVMVVRAVNELPVVAANGAARQLGLDRPAGKGPGDFPHVYVGVVAHAPPEALGPSFR